MGWIKLGRTRQLMVDNDLIEDRGETALVVHSWVKEEVPALVKEHAWEGIGPYAMNLVAFDPLESIYKMWYQSYDTQTKGGNVGYAESVDGLEWRRHTDMIPEDEIGAVAIDPRAGKGEYRFLSASFRRAEGELPYRITFHKSKDGINWEHYEDEHCWQEPSDVINVIWDSQRECFVTYHKLWRVMGNTPDGQTVKAYFATFEPKQEADKAIMRIEGVELFPALHAVSYELVNESTGKEDGGGGTVSGDVSMLRVIGRAESKDFIHWTNHEVVVEPLADDPVDVQYYGMPVVEYEALYIAFPRYFECFSGKMEARFAFSRDGRYFHFPDPKPVLACGEQGGWDAGMVIATPNIMEIGGRLCMYYGAYDQDHTKPETEVIAAIGRAWLRKDGFASFTGGTLRSKLLLIQGNQLFINAEGTIGIRLLDANGNLMGTAIWEGDSTSGIVEWQCGGISREPARLEFDLAQGHLYSLWSE